MPVTSDCVNFLLRIRFNLTSAFWAAVTFQHNPNNTDFEISLGVGITILFM